LDYCAPHGVWFSDIGNLFLKKADYRNYLWNISVGVILSRHPTMGSSEQQAP